MTLILFLLTLMGLGPSTPSYDNLGRLTPADRDEWPWQLHAAGQSR